MTRPWIIAHRGASGHAPENTLAAFRGAAALGAGFIETDLRTTADGRFVLLHDARVHRTTNGRGRVDRLGLEALAKLDAGSWFGKEFSSERIPTLEQALALVGELGLGLYLELKTALVGSLPLALAETLRQSGQLERTILLSFHPAALETMQAAEPTLQTALLVERPLRAIRRAAQGGAQQLAPRHTLVTPRLLRAAHRAHLPVVVWTVNRRHEMRRMLQMGVDGIMTNYPDRLSELLGELPAPPSRPEN